jgi:hypothetical protein
MVSRTADASTRAFPQARATLEMMLEDQLKRRREETADVKRWGLA